MSYDLTTILAQDVKSTDFFLVANRDPYRRGPGLDKCLFYGLSAVSARVMQAKYIHDIFVIWSVRSVWV